MLPVCSAATSCSCHTKVLVPGLKSLSPYSKIFHVKVHLEKVSFTARPIFCFYSNQIANSQNYVVPISMNNDEPLNLITDTINKTDSLSSFEGLPVDPPIVSNLLNIDDDSLSEQEKSIDDIISGINELTSGLISGGEDALNRLLDDLKNALKNANEAVDSAVTEIVSFFNKSGESAGNKLSGVSSELLEASGKAGTIGLDVMKRTIVFIEDSFLEGAKNVGYAYGLAKEYLPLDLREALNLSEENVAKVVNPAGSAFQQVYKAVEGFEESLGLDPNDPLVPIVLFISLSATLWGSYRILKYGGYAGDLSPQETYELLRGNENVVLVDIRPENLRERDGIPDLRRTARSRYIGVALSELDSSLRKLLKGGREIEDALLAAVIRNLKIVEDGSKVIVVDVDGSRSKGVARSLRKFGTKRPYLVQGGFRSWVNAGLRIKALKPETPLSILNEEAEAILEEINPTPVKILGYGLGFAAAAYSLVDWERTLQFVGVIGLSQTVFRRIASYQGAEDLKKDVSLLLAPVRLGGQAISWAAGKLDPNLNGLPTSPSSSDVRSRVLQAAAKHESQPSDSEGIQDSPSENDKVQASEA